jgi:hypothetical protein
LKKFSISQNSEKFLKLQKNISSFFQNNKIDYENDFEYPDKINDFIFLGFFFFHFNFLIKIGIFFYLKIF